MPKRLLTFLLLLSFLVPTSLLGYTLHSCGMKGDGSSDAMDMSFCCSQVFSELQQGDGTDQLSHRCHTVPGAVGLQPVAATFKTQYETPNPAECLPEPLVFPTPSDPLSRFSAGTSYFPQVKYSQSVFLRNCSFLI